MPTAGSSEKTVDAIVVGGGPAGLSAAIYLARYDRTVAVFDAGHGRSTHRQVNHNYLGFPGGVTAVTLRQLGKAQLAEYQQVDFEAHKVVDCLPEGDEFVAQGQFGRYRARVVIIASGVLDHYPHFHHWEEYVGVSMFWCITCDGYASKGKNVLVLGHTDAAAREALQLSRFTNRLSLVTNCATNEISPLFRERLARLDIPVIDDRIDQAEGVDGQLVCVRTESGREIGLDALFCTQGATPQVDLARDGRGPCRQRLYRDRYRATHERRRRIRRRRRDPHPRPPGDHRSPRGSDRSVQRQLLPVPGRAQS